MLICLDEIYHATAKLHEHRQQLENRWNGREAYKIPRTLFLSLSLLNTICNSKLGIKREPHSYFSISRREVTGGSLKIKLLFRFDRSSLACR